MIGLQVAAIRSRKSSARALSGPSRGLMKVMRSLGCLRRALMRSMPRGILEVLLVGAYANIYRAVKPSLGVWREYCGHGWQLRGRSRLFVGMGTRQRIAKARDLIL